MLRRATADMLAVALSGAGADESTPGEDASPTPLAGATTERREDRQIAVGEAMDAARR